ncbi:unnamed protein product, partial [Vitis vinifera]
MKITATTELPTTIPAILSSRARNASPDSDLISKRSSRKPPRRKARTPAGGARLKRDGAAGGRRSRPETPLLRWKFDDIEREKDANVLDVDEKIAPEHGRRSGRKVRKGREVTVSSRRLASGLWRLQLPGVDAAHGGRWSRQKSEDRLGFEPGIDRVRTPFPCQSNTKAYDSEAKDLLQSPHSMHHHKSGFLCRLEPSFQFSNSAMEGATKWNPVCSKTSDEVRQLYGQMKQFDQQVSAVSVVSALEAELAQARARIDELEAERRSSKKKLEHFLKKVSEERASWRRREHEKIRAIIDDVKTDLNRERKNRQRIELINSKLVNELSDVKLSAKRFMQDYEKERKDREVLEEVCDELAKEIGDDKAEAESLKRESMKLRDEMEEERKMLQMAEVWREERVQMKLVAAKVALEEKYAQMNKVMADIAAFLRSKGANPDVKEMKEVESLCEAAAAVNIQDVKEFTYVPPNPDDIFSILEEVNFGEPNEREIEACAAYNDIRRHSNAFSEENGDIEEDESGWETVSHAEDQGSSYSPGGSDPSETPITEISEVRSVPMKQLKKGSSISRLWKSCPNNGENYKIISVVEGMNGRLSNGRISSAGIMSPDRGSGKGGLSPPDLAGQWSSPDSGNPHVNRGMKGCIEWPRGAQKNSLKAKLLEARMESQKIQLRQVLKQKI